MIETMKQMVEALEIAAEGGGVDFYAYAKEGRQAIAEAEKQEPVKMVSYNCTCGRTIKFESVHGVVAPQRTFVGLTDEDRAEILNRKWWNFEDEFDVDGFLRLAEAKIKEKNGI